MATATIPPSTVVPPEDSNSNDVGIFVTQQAIGYVEYEGEEVQKIEELVKEFLKAAPSKEMLKDLLTIKLLMPEASRDLRIYTLPQAVGMIKKIKEIAVRGYYEKER